MITKNKFFISTIATISHLTISFAQNPNWAKDVAPVLYNKCTGCHHANGIAPFSLITYSDAQIHASSIQADVQSGKMPPWPPDTAYRHYAHERVLSPQEINTIVTWVNNGSLQGNPSLAPPIPVYNNGSFLDTPDLKLTIPQYTSVATTYDKYQCFSLPTNFSQDRFIKAIEIVPGNKQIVHHVVFFSDTASTVTVPTMDTSCDLSTTKLLGVYVPGATPTIFPNSGNVKMGMRLKAGAAIKLQIHYPKGSAGIQDSTSIHIFFYPVNTTGIREIYSDFLLGKWGLAFPPDSVKSYQTQYPSTGTIQSNYSFLGVFPHMHLIGKEIESYAVGPLNDTTRFVKINNWDFHWQDFYNFKKIIKVPVGSTLHATAMYDNTVNNPNNPYNPPQWVYDGEQTTDEMFLVAFQFLPYQTGDENIVLDSLLNPPVSSGEIPLSNFVCYAFPNPFSQQIFFQFYMVRTDIVYLDIYDIFGKRIRVIQEKHLSGVQQITWDGKDENGSATSSGIYFYKLETGGRGSSGKIVLRK